jgi:hypothetical protein
MPHIPQDYNAAQAPNKTITPAVTSIGPLLCVLTANLKLVAAWFSDAAAPVAFGPAGVLK